MLLPKSAGHKFLMDLLELLFVFQSFVCNDEVAQ